MVGNPEDFVYSVALSPDLTYCAFGGADKSVVVLNGHSGVQVCKIQLPGTWDDRFCPSRRAWSSVARAQ